MLKIGITGGIGSGKSVVCKVFALLGIPVYDSDFRVKWVMQHDLVLKQSLKDAFGDNVYKNEQLDRSYLAGLVFNQPEKLTLLNSLVHPRVREDFYSWLATTPEKSPYIIKEAALMFESNAYKQVDKVITVNASLETRIQRVLQRDPHRTSKDVQAIIDKQLSEEERQSRADFVIHNTGNQLVIPQVVTLHQTILALSQDQ